MKYLLIILISIFNLISVAQTQLELNYNSVKIEIENNGSIRDGMFEESGFLYCGGFILSGYVNDTLWVKSNTVDFAPGNNFVPGNVDSNQFDPRYNIYFVHKNDPAFGASWQTWRFAVDFGAKFYDGNNDGIYNPIDLNGNEVWDPDEDRPDLMGDFTAWCVYNDAINSSTITDQQLGIEIRQSVFGYGWDATYLKNVLFIRYEIINTGKTNSNLDSVYFSAFADPDIGVYLDDLIGVDTTVNAYFVYNDGEDLDYGNNPPAFFTALLEGPATFLPGVTFIDNNGNGLYDTGIDTPTDTAYNRKGYLGINIMPGAKNLDINAFSSYHRYEHIPGWPITKDDTRHFQKGLFKGGILCDPCTYYTGNVIGGINCSEVNPLFWFSGDPITQIGWVDTLANDYRTGLHTGQFTLNADEPVTILIAYIVDRGNDAINSITVSKSILQNTRDFYLDNFGIVVTSADYNELVVNEFNLFQNYPNPFNPVTKISWQSPVGSWQTLKVYDVLGNEVTTLINEFKPAGTYDVEFNSNSGNVRNLSSGVYFYQLKVGNFIATRKMLLLK